MDFETLAGIYVYAMDYHSGQTSRLYRLLSKIQFQASDRVFDIIRGETVDTNGEWYQAKQVYYKLQQRKAV